MLGAIIGDIAGAPYEFAGVKSKSFEPLIRPLQSFTDDTVCTVAIADAILNEKQPAVALREWCQRYERIGGWGKRFALWFCADVIEPPYNSYGNGAAMRISPVGFLAEDENQVIDWATTATVVTHNHPQAIKAALATALAIHWFRNGKPPSYVQDQLQTRFGYNLSASVDEIRSGHRRSESSEKSVPPAITCALQATDFVDAIRNAVSLGGDSDTQAAIAGSIAEARFGIPEGIARQAWQVLPADMRSVLSEAYRRLSACSN